jgi:hypothetical protein
MRVSVVNFCSAAIGMLDFSMASAERNAGTDDYDPILLTWEASPEVLAWVRVHPRVQHVVYEADPALAYVPNLRRMMSQGFDEGYKVNPFTVILNTDMAFGRNWLYWLVLAADEATQSSGICMSPIKSPLIVTENFGVTEPATFDEARFWKRHDQLWQPGVVQTEDERGGLYNCEMLPYCLHETWWRLCGPWEPNHVVGREPPDRRFFERCHAAGLRFKLAHGCVCYHHEAVERRGPRPAGLEGFPTGL